MKYNTLYINIKYALLEAFMHKASSDILDISYSNEGKTLTIQVVLLEETNLSDEVKKKVKNNLSEFDIKLNELHISKERFNENKGEWKPKYYNWLEHLLFSKAEAL